MDFQSHTKEQVYQLVEKAFQLDVKPDELWIAISRLTNVRESEKVRLERINAEHEKFAKEHRHDPEPGTGEDE